MIVNYEKLQEDIPPENMEENTVDRYRNKNIFVGVSTAPSFFIIFTCEYVKKTKNFRSRSLLLHLSDSGRSNPSVQIKWDEPFWRTGFTNSSKRRLMKMVLCAILKEFEGKP